MGRGLRDTFWEHTLRTDSGCLEFTRAPNGNGYARFWLDSERRIYAHQFAFLSYYGYLPEVVCHACDNPKCVDPLHLFAGTHAENAKDKQRKGRALKKLTAAQVAAIKADPRPQRAIARDYGVTQRAVWNHKHAEWDED